MSLNVKTRGSSSPQGKARAYLCCHPDDLEHCLEVLSGDIFATQNCAIYYGEPSEADLAEMRLFVAALTTRFLTRDCRAKSFEYGFALEHRIPVLPIAMEPGMEALFPEIMNRVRSGYGDVQFLDRTLADQTAIPYEEKLKKRLESILGGNELVERVRAAFDAYIFLSYRKKDRAEARMLMERIHCIPFCRDTAIWYDEYLIPGEGWSEAIAAAMAKSAAVVLVVTPSLTEPDNYIIRREYPDAKCAGKKIIPAELLPTDPETLKALFPELPDTVDCRDPEALAEALRPLIQKEGSAESESPAHNYLIGLAYLGGIDVERNTDTAVRLITSAAERELPEAIKKLAEMYQNGDGVARNYETAAEWLRKLVAVRRRAYEASKSERNGEALFDACRDCGNTWFDMGRISRAESLYREMLKTAQELEDSFASAAHKQELSVSYKKLGNIAKEQGDLPTAELWYKKSRVLFRALAAETGAAKAQRNLSINCNKLGDAARSQGDLPTAKAWYRKGLKQFRELEETRGTPETHRDLSISYNRMGDIAKAEGDLPTAKEWYEKGLELCRALVAETGTVQARRELSVTYLKLGDIARRQKDRPTARAWYEKALELDKVLETETGTVQARRDLYICLFKIWRTPVLIGDILTGEQMLKEALSICRELAEETDHPQIRKDLTALQNCMEALNHAAEKT